MPGPSLRRVGNGPIAFVAEKHDSPDETELGFERIYAVDPDGTGLIALQQAHRQDYSSEHFGQLDWFPDGSRLTVVGEPVHFITDAAGSRRVRLPLDQLVQDLAWSPDGRRAALVDGQGLSIWERGTRGARRVVLPWKARTRHGSRSPAGSPSWYPNGTRLAVVVKTTRRPGDGTGRRRTTSSVHVFSLDGQDLGPIAGTHGASGARLSPNGRRLLLLRGGEGNCPAALLTVPVTGGKPQRLTGLSCERQPTFDWSPDGNFVAYADHPGGQPSIWVISPAGGDPRLVVSGADAGADRIGDIAWRPVA